MHSARSIGLFTVLLGLAVALLPAPAVATLVSSWDASSGLLPDEIATNPWTLNDTASPEDPVLSAGVLTLSTSSTTENMTYLLTDVFDVGDGLALTADVRYVSGGSTSAARTPIMFGFTVDDSLGMLFLIGQDSIRLLSGNTTIGSSAVVDTDDAFHEYVITYDGVGTFDVFYDGGLLLSGSPFVDAGTHGSTLRVFWGEVSSNAFGTSEWTSVDLEVFPAIPEPGSASLLALGLVAVGWNRRRHA